MAGPDGCATRPAPPREAAKRKARGYRSTEYQTTMLYFVAGKLEIPYYA
jgi:hypothetical protein